MSKSRKTAASVTAPEATEVVQVTVPEVVPVAEVAAPEKKKMGRAELRAMGVGLVFEDLETARASRPTNKIAENSSYELWTVSNGRDYYVWSIDQRRALEFVARHVGFTATRTDKPVRQSAVTAIKDENAALKAKIAEYEAKLAAMNGAAG
jgi:hypothetical protein